MNRVAISVLAGLLAFGSPLPARALECNGTEPFWSLKIGGGKIVLDQSDRGPRRLQTVAPRAAQGRPPDLVRVYQTRTLGAIRQYVTIVIRRAEHDSCSDGMSDVRYPYHAVVVEPGAVLEGCCKW